MVQFNLPAARSFYYSYPPYLQPTPSVGTGSRFTGSIAMGTRPKIGGAGRIYNYFQSLGQGQTFINQVIFANYGLTTNS